MPCHLGTFSPHLQLLLLFVHKPEHFHPYSSNIQSLPFSSMWECSSLTFAGQFSPCSIWAKLKSSCVNRASSNSLVPFSDNHRVDGTTFWWSWLQGWWCQGGFVAQKATANIAMRGTLMPPTPTNRKWTINSNTIVTLKTYHLLSPVNTTVIASSLRSWFCPTKIQWKIYSVPSTEDSHELPLSMGISWYPQVTFLKASHIILISYA